MSDHKKEAEEWLERGFQTSHAEHENRCVAMAQAHATLYLAEQQRLANLIAYWQLHTPRSIQESLTEPGQIEVKQIHDNADVGVDVQIREGLGLA